jgi:ElaB/YqjD/DUF883 family membrane-anchored ribosome-binding protein
VDDELERREERELEVIRGQMDRTRAKLGEKLEALESQVKDTVQVATEGVTAAVEGVKETVETVSETVSSVTDTFNVSRHIEQHPWAAMGCSLATGFALGFLTGGDSSSEQPQQQQTAPPRPAAQPAQAAPTAPRPAEETGSAKSSLWEAAMMGLRTLGVQAVTGVMRGLIKGNLPQEMHQELHKIVGGITEGLGLKPEDNPIPAPDPEARPEEQGQPEGRGQPDDQMAGPRETPRRHNARPRQSASA